MIYKIAFLLALAPLLSACASSVENEQSQVNQKQEPVKTQIELSPEQKEEAKQAVRNKMKDPDSAQFSDLYGVSNESLKSGYSVCGYVNAKNSFGGYVGKRPFSYSNGAVIMPSSGTFSEFDRDLINELCTPNASPAR